MFGIGRFWHKILDVIVTFLFVNLAVQKMLTESNKNFHFFLTSYLYHWRLKLRIVVSGRSRKFVWRWSHWFEWKYSKKLSKEMWTWLKFQTWFAEVKFKTFSKEFGGFCKGQIRDLRMFKRNISESTSHWIWIVNNESDDWIFLEKATDKTSFSAHAQLQKFSSLWNWRHGSQGRALEYRTFRCPKVHKKWS